MQPSICKLAAEEYRKETAKDNEKAREKAASRKYYVNKL